MNRYALFLNLILRIFSHMLGILFYRGHFSGRDEAALLQECSGKCVFVPLSANLYIGSHQFTGSLMDSAGTGSCRAVELIATIVIKRRPAIPPWNEKSESQTAYLIRSGSEARRMTTEP